MKKMQILSHLKFDTELEKSYRIYSTSKDKTYIRIAFMLFSLLYALFSFTDYILVPQWFSLFFAIRFFIVIPTLLITILLTYHPNYYKWKQPLLLFNYFIGGMGICTMLILEPLNIIYYGGLFLIFTSGYFMLHLTTKYAIVGGFSVLSLFILGTLYVGNMSMIVFSATLFLVAENLIGSMGAYQIDRFKRNEFLHVHNLNLEQEALHTTVNEKIEEISIAQISTISALAKLAESRDKETGEHIERVGQLCYQLANNLPLHYFTTLEEKIEFSNAIRLASTLHDIGKVGISDAILNKPGPLNDEELRIMRTHSQIGSATLAKLNEQYPKNFLIKLGIEITHSHHERWDGSGYPDGLKGEEIPLSARIMAITDVYDALVSKRPYKPPFPHEQAFSILKDESGKHFDPDLIPYFLSLFI